MIEAEDLTDDEFRDIVRWADVTPCSSYYADAAKSAALDMAKHHGAKLIAAMLSRGVLRDDEDPMGALDRLMSGRHR